MTLRRLSGIFVFLTFLTTFLHAQNTKKTAMTIPDLSTDTTRMNFNRVDLALSNEGSTGLDGISFYPAGSGITFLFSGGIAVSGYVEDTLRVSWVYRAAAITDFQPGPVGMAADNPRMRFYTVTRFDPPGGEAYQEWAEAVALGAEFRDVNNDGIYEPEVDQPPLIGDQMTWCVFNDEVSPLLRRWNTKPLHLEVQQTVWAYQFGLPDVIFFRYKLVNRGEKDIDSVIFSCPLDPDLGNYEDDLIGCDTLLNLGFAYNDGTDWEYGDTPPAFGVQLIQGPLVDAPGEVGYRFHPESFTLEQITGMRNLPMVSFYQPFLVFGFDCWTTAESSRLMQIGGVDCYGQPLDYRQWGNGNNLTEPPNLVYWYSGDPLNPNGINSTTDWLDTMPSDKRIMINSGPFQLPAGESQEIICAYVLGQGSDYLNSIAVMKDNAVKVHEVYNAQFRTVSPLSAATVYPRTFDRTIELIIDLNDLIGYRDTDAFGNQYVFEGFTIYQLREPEAILELDNPGRAIPIVRFDVNDQYGDLYAFDAVGRLKLVWEGQNNLDSTMLKNPASAVIRQVITRDEFTEGQPLLNHQEYYFAVAPFSINVASAYPNDDTIHIPDDWILPDALGFFPTPSEMIGVISASPGISEFTPFGTITAEHVEGMSEGAVVVDAVSHHAITGEDYRVNFFGDGEYWRLTNLSQSQVVLDSMTSQGFSGEEWNFPVIDGVSVRVFNVEDRLARVDTTGMVWLVGSSGANLSDKALYDGGIDLAKLAEGYDLSDIKRDAYFPVEIEFDTVNVAKAYWYRLSTFQRFQNVMDVFFRAFEVDESGNRIRQVNICYTGPQLGIDFYNNRLMIMSSDYSESGAYNEFTDQKFKEEAFIILELIPKTDSLFQAGKFSIFITPNFPNSDADVFEFSTASLLQQLTMEERRQKLTSVKVVPNPFFGSSIYDSRYQKPVIKFIHLDNPVTIRIFDLAGRLVKVLRKDDPFRNELTWDLRNHAGRRVGSGMYLAHISVPGLGNTVVKFAIIQREGE